MSGEKRDETEAGEEDYGLNKEPERSIGQALRRAAGLPDEEDPFVKHSYEARPPYYLRLMTALIEGSRNSVPWQNPRAAEAELEAIRSDLKKLKKRIASLDANTQVRINAAGGPEHEEIDVRNLDEMERIHAAERVAWEAVPPEQWAIPAALSAIEQLEAAIFKVIEEAIEKDTQLPKTGRIPNIHARKVAFLVAHYLYDTTGYAETGSIPGLTTRPVVTGPFALALQEIFEILNIRSGIQRPGEWAISELTSKLSENSEF